MRLLWDFRLFSLGYKNKGVGRYTISLVNSFLKENSNHKIYLLGDEEDIPNDITSHCEKVINYKELSWKKDLFSLSKIVRKYKIDIFHYWISLGPLHQIGLGYNLPCKTISTIHDMAVESWDEIPFLESKKKSWYWRIQKLLINQINHIIFNSQDTKKNFLNIVNNYKGFKSIIYPEIELNKIDNTRQNNLVALGGSESKNLKRTINAFNLFQDDKKTFNLTIIGDTKELNKKNLLNSNITFVPYSNYSEYLSKASALLSFSIHEGLGIPPIEAMSLGVPSAVSNIPSYKETLSDSAIYADPLNIYSMKDAINEVVLKNNDYKDKVERQYIKYKNRTKLNGKTLLKIYNNLFQDL